MLLPENIEELMSHKYGAHIFNKWWVYLGIISINSCYHSIIYVKSPIANYHKVNCTTYLFNMNTLFTNYGELNSGRG